MRQMLPGAVEWILSFLRFTCLQRGVGRVEVERQSLLFYRHKDADIHASFSVSSVDT